MATAQGRETGQQSRKSVNEALSPCAAAGRVTDMPLRGTQWSHHSWRDGIWANRSRRLATKLYAAEPSAPTLMKLMVGNGRRSESTNH
jgi:hypothetical protein